MTHIDYSSDIPKHFVRRQGWLNACQKQAAIVKKRSKQIPLRYFTFCAAEAIDVFMLEREGIICRSQETGRLEGVYFCEKNDEDFGVIAGLIGSPEQGFRGEFERIVLFSDDEDTNGRTLEDIVPYTPEIRKKLQYKDAQYRLHGSFPFDIINLDVFGVMFPPRKGVITPLLKSIIQMLLWQTNSNFPINNLPCNQFTLFLTTHIDPDRTDKEVIQQLHYRLIDNIMNHEDFRIAFEDRYGHQEAQRLSEEQFSEFFCIALSKYIINYSLFQLGWYVTYGPMFLYNREDKWVENKTYEIMHSVSIFNRIPNFGQRLDEPTIGSYIHAVTEIINKGIVLVDNVLIDPRINIALSKDLERIVEFRDRFHQTK